MLPKLAILKPLCASLALIFSLLLPSVTFAHSGHDHSAPESGLIHLLWLLPAIIAIAYAGYRLVGSKNDKSTSKK